MRIEINAGGISGAITVLQFQAAASKHLEKSNDVISAFVTVQRKTSQIEGQTPRLQEAQGCTCRTSTNRGESKGADQSCQAGR